MSDPMSSSARLGFDALNAALKAAGEETRLRVLALLAEAELTVSDLTDILRQSEQIQPGSSDPAPASAARRFQCNRLSRKCDDPYVVS